nr:hypothetical protein [Tanacetum cinerariifolium]
IDLKDKGKGVSEEPKPTKKMTRNDLDVDQIAKDAEVARLVYQEELAEQKRMIDDFKPMDSDDAVDKEKVLQEPNNTMIEGRKKYKPTLDDSTLDDLDADHGMDTEEPMNQGRLSKETVELVSIARPEDSTVRPDVGNADPIAPLTSSTTSISDDEHITMSQTLIKMKEEKAKEKRDKGKGVSEEPKPTKKMTRNDLDVDQIAKDAEVARLVYQEELAELEREKENNI